MTHLEALQFIFFSSQIITVFSWTVTVVLDRDMDVNGGTWKIDGDAEYFDNTYRLRLPSVVKYLPSGFHHQRLGFSRGIWGIFPRENTNCSLSYGDCDRSASVAFIFTPSSQIVEKVKVRYAFGGKNATLRVIGLGGKESHGSDMEEWMEFSSEVRRQAMTLEASVGGLGDYILIDMITVVVLIPDVVVEMENTSARSQPSRDNELKTPRPHTIHDNLTSSKSETQNVSTNVPEPESNPAREEKGSKTPELLGIFFVSFICFIIVFSICYSYF